MLEKTIALVNVRMGSSRFPGKALYSVLGKPLLGHLLDRLSLVQRLDDIVVATSVNTENDSIERYCIERDIACFRGSEEDVLGRMVAALQRHNANYAAVIFGDQPLLPPDIVADLLDQFFSKCDKPDFLGNDLKTTYPPGFDLEVIRAEALADSALRCNDPSLREHGTLFIRQNPRLYSVIGVEAPPHLKAPDLELEVDEPQDIPVVEAVLRHFDGRPDAMATDIIAFCNSKPDLKSINQHVERRWKVARGELS